jgi:hypothetical protein
MMILTILNVLGVLVTLCYASTILAEVDLDGDARRKTRLHLIALHLALVVSGAVMVAMEPSLGGELLLFSFVCSGLADLIRKQNKQRRRASD